VKHELLGTCREWPHRGAHHVRTGKARIGPCALEHSMNSLTPIVRCLALVLLAAVSLLFVLRAAAAVEPAVAEQRPAAVNAQAPAAVAATEPAPQRRLNAPSVAASAADAPAQPPAVDWSLTPRRSAQGRRR
jgi:hypothetical protein